MMATIHVNELIPLLQIAISPVILISGVGLLLLSMTNRFGRVIDRSRFLWGELDNEPAGNRASIHAQLEVLMRRAKLIRLAIILASTSVLGAAVLVIVLFGAVWLGIDLAWLIILLFIGCLLSLVASLIVFIKDVNQSLNALKILRGAE